MPKQPPAIRITCTKCKKQLIWPLIGFSVNVVGMIQVRCHSCEQVVSWPKQAVWGLEQHENEENLVARIFSDDNE